jgi:hypothetical protein
MSDAIMSQVLATIIILQFQFEVASILHVSAWCEGRTLRPAIIMAIRHFDGEMKPHVS